MKPFATLTALALHQNLWHMGKAVLMAHPETAETRFSAPNKHHVIIQAAVSRDDTETWAWAPGAGLA